MSGGGGGGGREDGMLLFCLGSISGHTPCLGLCECLFGMGIYRSVTGHFPTGLSKTGVAIVMPIEL